MKHSFMGRVSAGFFMLAIGAGAAFSQSTSPYIVPVDADGTPMADKIRHMTENGGFYEIKGLEIESGFLFAGIGQTEGTYYSLNSWAVNPPVYGLLNPLSISAGNQYIKMPSGTYDLKFYTRQTVGSGYNHFTIVPSDDTEGPFYPEKLFLLLDDGSNIVVTGTDGVYTLSENIPESFKISYEPRDDSNYIYGALDGSDTELEAGEAVAIGLDKGVNVKFVCHPQELADDDYELVISLVNGDSFVRIGADETTALDFVEADGDSAEVRYYTLQGHMLDHVPQNGLYLRVCGSKVTKVAL